MLLHFFAQINAFGKKLLLIICTFIIIVLIMTPVKRLFAGSRRTVLLENTHYWDNAILSSCILFQFVLILFYFCLPHSYLFIHQILSSWWSWNFAIVIDPIHSSAYNAASFILTYLLKCFYHDIDSLRYHVPLLHFSLPSLFQCHYPPLPSLLRCTSPLIGNCFMP